MNRYRVTVTVPQPVIEWTETVEAYNADEALERADAEARETYRQMSADVELVVSDVELVGDDEPAGATTESG